MLAAQPPGRTNSREVTALAVPSGLEPTAPSALVVPVVAVWPLALVVPVVVVLLLWLALVVPVVVVLLWSAPEP